MPGTLTIVPVQAELTHDTEIFGKMDPYWTVIIGPQNHDGQVCKSGGKNPRWGDGIALTVNDERVFFIELKDENILKDDVIGLCQVSIQDVVAQPQLSKWYPVYYKKQPAGQILLKLTYEAHGAQKLNPAPQAQTGEILVQEAYQQGSQPGMESLQSSANFGGQQEAPVGNYAAPEEVTQQTTATLIQGQQVETFANIPAVTDPVVQNEVIMTESSSNPVQVVAGGVVQDRTAVISSVGPVEGMGNGVIIGKHRKIRD